MEEKIKEKTQEAKETKETTKEEHISLKEGGLDYARK